MEERIRRAEILVEALPYIRRFSGCTVVIKLGGAAMETAELDAVLEDIVLLRFVGMHPVVVHGGGPEISAWQQRFGIEPRFVNGLRVTDAQTMELAKMVLTGKIGPDLVARIHRLGGRAMGLSGEDGPTLLVHPRTSEDGHDLGFVGEVDQVNSEPIQNILDQGRIPVLASVGLGYDGEAYNVNADTVAAELAIALKATKLILLTDIDGVRGADGTLLTEIDAERAASLISAGIISGGMIPKVKAALHSLERVVAAHIIDGRVPHALLLELLTASGVGTMLRPAGDASQGVAE
ncbi:MAG: acetylglutamate kinase [Candidatus Dormibacteria bacterium]